MLLKMVKVVSNHVTKIDLFSSLCVFVGIFLVGNPFDNKGNNLVDFMVLAGVAIAHLIPILVKPEVREEIKKIRQ